MYALLEEQGRRLFPKIATAYLNDWADNDKGWLRKFYPPGSFVAAEKDLTITTDFAGFGREITALRKRLRTTGGINIFDTFPPYGAWFKRRFGIDNEQALELFHQTVSLKSVGNLTEFVRLHMLEPFAVNSRIEALLGHFDDLNRAHEAVLKAKAQVAQLTPLVARCDRYDEESARREQLVACRDALRGWLGGIKLELLRERLAALDGELRRHQLKIEGLAEQRRELQARERELREWLQDKIDAISRKTIDMRDKIIAGMRAVSLAYPLETHEMDVAPAAMSSWRPAPLPGGRAFPWAGKPNPNPTPGTAPLAASASPAGPGTWPPTGPACWPWLPGCSSIPARQSTCASLICPGWTASFWKPIGRCWGSCWIWPCRGPTPTRI